MGKNKKSSVTYLGVILILIIALIISILIAVNIGAVPIPTKDIVDVILFKLGIKESIDHLPRSTFDIVWFVRLPRLILGTLVGISLAVSGVVMQAIVKNPLADPYILGISSGASLGASAAIVLGIGTALGSNYIGISAFIFAFLVSIMVVILANFKGRATSTKLLLSGMAISTVVSSISSFLIYVSGDRDAAKSVAFWLLGSLAGAKWENIIFITPIIILSVVFFISQYRVLNLMLLGDDVAITLGRDLHRYRQLYLLVSSLIIGFVVYCSGVIGFVGLIIPHLARMLFGTDHKKIVPISALFGAILLVWADVFSRIIVPNTEVPTGILISLIGAPCFIYLIISKSSGFGGRER